VQSSDELSDPSGAYRKESTRRPLKVSRTWDRQYLKEEDAKYVGLRKKTPKKKKKKTKKKKKKKTPNQKKKKKNPQKKGSEGGLSRRRENPWKGVRGGDSNDFSKKPSGGTVPKDLKDPGSLGQL